MRHNKPANRSHRPDSGQRCALHTRIAVDLKDTPSMRPPNQASNLQASPEPCITKQRLAEHLSVTTRWIELQRQRGLPHIHTPA
jgi:hypothetical protein